MNGNERARMALSLLRVPSVGLIGARNLISENGSIERLFAMPIHQLRAIPRYGEALAMHLHSETIKQHANNEIKKLTDNGIRIRYIQDDEYPKSLANTQTPPLLLFLQADQDVNLNAGRYLAIVGTRRSTSYGRDAVQRIIDELAKRVPNLIIVSGLAHGIDAEAHRSALRNGLKSIGVIAHGHATIYPVAHRTLYQELRAQGAVISEYLYDDRAERSTFIHRNRIIAGLCAGALIAESDIRGGAMSTAAYAFHEGREVFAIPGQTNAPTSAGCNALIKRNRAKLTENAEDIIQELELIWGIRTKTEAELAKEDKAASLFYQPSETEKPIIEYLHQHGVCSLDELARATNMPIPKFNSTVMMLEFQNVIRRLPGNLLELN